MKKSFELQPPSEHSNEYRELSRIKLPPVDLDFSEFEEYNEDLEEVGPCFPIGELKDGEISAVDNELFNGIAEVDGQTYLNYNIHFYDEKIFTGEHPIPEKQEEVQETFLEIAHNGLSSVQKLRQLPDRNNKYEELIAQIREVSSVKDGEVKILDEETYTNKVGSDSWGEYDQDTMIIREKADVRIMERTGIHEAIHHDRHHGLKTLLLVTRVDSKTGNLEHHESAGGPAFVFSASNYQFRKINTFFEEAYTTERTTRLLESSGHFSQQDIVKINKFVVTDRDNNDRILTIPTYKSYTPYESSAIGLRILEAHTPGLIEKLDAARHSPQKFQEVIDTTNAISPGLYETLRDIPQKDIRGGEIYKTISGKIRLLNKS